MLEAVELAVLLAMDDAVLTCDDAVLLCTELDVPTDDATLLEMLLEELDDAPPPDSQFTTTLSPLPGLQTSMPGPPSIVSSPFPVLTVSFPPPAVITLLPWLS